MLEVDGSSLGQGITSEPPDDQTSSKVDYNGTKQIYQQLAICGLQWRLREI